MFVLMILLGVVGIVIMTLYTIAYLDYHSHIKGCQCISFKQYLRMSACAPNKWRIEDHIYCRLIYGERYHERVTIYMKSYLDQWRLKSLYKKLKKKVEDTDYSIKRAKLLESWQKDINMYQEKYTEELKRMKERIDNDDKRISVNRSGQEYGDSTLGRS